MQFCGHQCQPSRRSIPEWEAGFRGLRVPISCGSHWILPRAARKNAHVRKDSQMKPEPADVDFHPGKITKNARPAIVPPQDPAVIRKPDTKPLWRAAVEKNYGKVVVKLDTGEVIPEKRSGSTPGSKTKQKRPS
mmetsp:Transcript_3047/g.7075  ORF Transcript_3047/g.7075 Transcript_3047/m.7075 type:complete len:134 (-) Transcript_3047:138-539(-)